MQRIITSIVLLLSSLGIACGQGTIGVNFDGSPAMPPGSSANWGYYSESEVAVHTVPSLLGFTRRWSGGALFPNNGSAYLQPIGGSDFFFNYGGSSLRFNAVSVDLALYSASSLEPVTVQFVAFGYSRFTDIIATTEFTISGAVDGQGRPLFQTFNFPPEFRGMYYLSVTPTAPLWSLDNLVISIPEPSVFALLAAGGFMLWAWRRRG